VAARADSGDAAAALCLEAYEDRLARGLASVINILDPDAVVLGGGVSNVRRLYENVPKRLERYVFSDRVETMIAAAAYGDSSGVRGAAMLWRER
jgi:fructokinase